MYKVKEVSVFDGKYTIYKTLGCTKNPGALPP